MFKFWLLSFFSCLVQLLVTKASVYVLRNVPFSVVVASFEDVVSRFGPELFHLDGFLTVAYPINACEPISPRPAAGATFISESSSTDKITNLPYIVLVERGECDFDLKVFNAQNANYSGVIVYNTVPNEIFPMGGKKYIKDIFIPAVMVNKAAGDKLRTYAIAEGQKEFVISMVSFYSLPLKYVLLSLLVLVGVSLIFLIVCFAAHLCNLWRRMRRGRLSRRHLRRLQTKRFEKAQDPYETCPICLEDYKEREKLRLLPCHHAFHTRCIDPWLLRNRRRCPVCNQTVELPGAPAPEDVVSVHDPVQRASFRTRLRRMRLLFLPHSAAMTHRDRTEWTSSADSSLSSVNSPVPNEHDEERAPLLEQNRSPQASHYTLNPAYLTQLVTRDETLEQSPLLNIIVTPRSNSAPIPEDEELLRVHVDVPTPCPPTSSTVSASSVPCTKIVSKDRVDLGNNGRSHSVEDEQLLSDICKPTIAIN